jgi:hypothetical protein
MRKSERMMVVERVKAMIDRSPWLSDTRVAKACGVGRGMVLAIRSREFGLGRATVKDDMMFSESEMERLDGWLRDKGLMEEWE